MPPAADRPRRPGALTLGECLAIAREQQPTIRAALLSYQASEAGYAALGNLGTVPELVTPDLPIRKRQAERGLTLAAAEVQKALQETTQDVTVLYYSYVYARQQEQTAADISEQLQIYYDIAEGIVKSGARQPGSKLDQFSLYALAKRHRRGPGAEAQGRDGPQARPRSPAGRDGRRHGVRLPAPAAKELPLMMGGTVTKEQVVAEATARRPELAQAAAGVDAFRLEVCAQAAVKVQPAGADARQRQRPARQAGADGRPQRRVQAGGARPGDARHARRPHRGPRPEGDFALEPAAGRALRPHGEPRPPRSGQGLPRPGTRRPSGSKAAKAKFERGKMLLEQSRAAAIARQDPELLVTNEALAGRAQSEYVEAVYEHIKTLAALERITAGGVTTQFPGR